MYEGRRPGRGHDFITRLPSGYRTPLAGNGANLSQGQRQLIAIARAAVADPPVMILDEATSSIDTRTEAIVQRGMDALMQGRTVFVIAHRLSTVKNADVILVLEQGRIIERGSHDDLLAEKGKYYQLYTGAILSWSRIWKKRRDTRSLEETGIPLFSVADKGELYGREAGSDIVPPNEKTGHPAGLSGLSVPCGIRS